MVRVRPERSSAPSWSSLCAREVCHCQLRQVIPFDVLVPYSGRFRGLEAPECLGRRHCMHESPGSLPPASNQRSVLGRAFALPHHRPKWDEVAKYFMCNSQYNEICCVIFHRGSTVGVLTKYVPVPLATFEGAFSIAMLPPPMTTDLMLAVSHTSPGLPLFIHSS